MAQPVFPKLAIIGAGLIGSSIALAAKAKGTASEIALYDMSKDVRARARKAGLPGVKDSVEAAAQSADCTLLCVPVGALKAASGAIAPHLKAGSILSDVGSVKGAAYSAMAEHCPQNVYLIPGHPIAGTEKSGPEAGFSSLFENRWHILTPQKDQSDDYRHATDRLAEFWRKLGARIAIMGQERHDRVLAMTSHLPHLIAYNIVSTAYDMETVDEGEVVKYSAGGFRDFTRIAASDPTMWRDIFLTNKTALLETLDRFSEDLNALRAAICADDGEELFKAFERARGIRHAILEAGEDADMVNFGRNPKEDI